MKLRKMLSIVLSVSLIGGMLGAGPVSATEATTTGSMYYIDNVNGDDAHNGQAEDSAWKTLDKVNGTEFQPGDQILFKAGGTWQGMLQPKGSGDETAQITIDRYGDGKKPLIEGGGAEAAVKLDGQEYWTIRNLEVTNKAEARAIRQGIFVYGKAEGITHRIIIEDCEVRDVTGENRRSMPTYESMYWNSGIYVSMPGRSTATSHFDEVLIDGNYVHDVLTSGIRINQREDFIVDPYHTNVIIRNNRIERTGSDGMIVANCDSPLIEYNTCLKAGALGNRSDTKIIAGMWACGTKNAVFQYNEVGDTVLFDSDGTAFDTDWGTGGTTIFQYNYTHGNQGGFWLDCAGINKDPSHVKTILRYNVSVDDGAYLIRAGDMPTEVYNNTFYKSTGKLDACFGNAGTQHKFWNNIFYFQQNPNWASSEYQNNLYYPCEPAPTDSAAITADPMLVSPGPAQDGIEFADNFKISDDSPCVNMGAFIPENGGKDFWGTDLSYGATDVGACETTVTEAPDTDTYLFSRGFSTTQGENSWYYMDWDGSSYAEMTWNTELGQWQGRSRYNLIWAPTKLHPDANDTALAWKAEKAGTVQVTGNPKKSDVGNDGVKVKIMKNDQQVWPASGWQSIGGSDTTGVRHDVTVSVEPGDMLYFVLNKNVTTYNDGTSWNPKISYSVEEKYNLSQDFSSTQGERNWYYLESSANGYQEMTWNTTENRWKGTNTYSLVWSPAQLHPDGNDTAVAWKSPKAGKITVTGNPRKSNLGYDGVNVKIMKNDQQVWPVSGWQYIAGNDSTGYSHNVALTVEPGDEIYFVLNQNINNYSDEVYWNPTILYE